MQLRRVRLSEDGTHTVAVRDGDSGVWVPLAPALAQVQAGERGTFAELARAGGDVIAFLRGGERLRAQAGALLEEVRGEARELAGRIDEHERQLPFAARSFRAFSIFEAHMTDSARMLAKRFFPPMAGRAIDAFERLTGRTAPPLKPRKGFYEHPSFYMGNHTAFFADGDTVPWPRYSEALDYELEMGFVLAKPVRDVDEQAGRAAIAGLFLVNDFSARDTQAEEYRHGVFGPVVRSKTFANAMAATVVTADELGDRAEQLEGVVRVNGELWSRGSNASATHSLGDMVAWASTSEQLMPGDVLSTGTFPGCCGLELDRWLKPDDVVELEVPELGTLTNRIGDANTPARVEDSSAGEAQSVQAAPARS
jgi:2-keto-4-pentenoate hydratase/2-oxohepta-3-ene-1,7-dioic acid hydratase in catechol pathway